MTQFDTQYNSIIKDMVLIHLERKHLLYLLKTLTQASNRLVRSKLLVYQTLLS